MKRVEVPATDLSGLDSFNLSDLGTVQTGGTDGKPVRILLQEIEEDPDNSRTEIDEDYIKELAGSIAVSDVKEPISVRSKGENGKHRLNSGFCRLLASRMVPGKTDIPAFIDDDWDDDDRFVVNVQRKDLSPMDQARYLAKRLPKFGGNRSELAKRIGKSSAYITQHLSLLELPPSIQQLYDKNVCRNVTSLYELVRLHKKDTQSVEQAIAGATEIGEAMLEQLRAGVKAKQAPAETENSSDPKDSDAPKAKNPKETEPAGDQLNVRILVAHKGKRYELVGKFVTTMRPTAGRVYVRKGSEKPIQIAVEDLALDQILVK
jgi:ParB family chromosome partitioning protein